MGLQDRQRRNDWACSMLSSRTWLPTVSLPQAVEEDIPKQKEQTHFTVRLTEAKPVDKVKLIKEIKNYIQGINLVQVSSGHPLPGWAWSG